MPAQKKKDTNDPLNYLDYPEFTVKTHFIQGPPKPGSGKGAKEPIQIHLLIAPEKSEKKEKKKKEKKPLLKDYPLFDGKPREILQTPSDWFYGLGTLKKLDSESLSDMMRELMQRVSSGLKNVIIHVPSELFSKIDVSHISNIFATALGVSLYPVDLLKTETSQKKIKLKEVSFALPSAHREKFTSQFKKYFTLSKHMNGMRQIQSLPGNYLTPQTAESRARDMASKFKLKIKVFDKKALKEMGAGGILAVSQGSAREPRLIIMEYNPTGAKKKLSTLALVGKGVTFDTGGISLKPSGDMHEMKYDMSGSAAVLHAVAAIAELKLPIHVVGVVGMVENMPGGAAFKPGDVYTSLKGLTIEVQNTDAEGRLVLGDLLNYTEENYKPDLMINLATLTGACMVALGQFYAGCFSRQEKVIDLIREASQNSLEPVWPLPLSKRYTEMLKSDIADHNNIGGRWGGASTAAGFLSLFVDEDTNWAHLDIAGIGFIKSSFQLYPHVASGYGVRLLTEIAEKLISSPIPLPN